MLATAPRAQPYRIAKRSGCHAVSTERGNNGLSIDSAEITGLLKAWSSGDEAALNRLSKRVYPELRLMERAVV